MAASASSATRWAELAAWLAAAPPSAADRIGHAPARSLARTARELATRLDRLEAEAVRLEAAAAEHRALLSEVEARLADDMEEAFAASLPALAERVTADAHTAALAADAPVLIAEDGVLVEVHRDGTRTVVGLAPEPVPPPGPSQ